MVTARQIGHLGGWAVALGIGAAIASAGPAHADSTEADSPPGSPAAKNADAGASSGVNDGPKRPKPLSKIGDRIDRVAAQANATVTSATRTVKASTPVTKPLTRPVTKPVPKPKPNPEEFEAAQVERLKSLFEPNQAGTTPAPTNTNDSSPAVTTAAITPTVTTERDPNPFRAEDPGPYGIPDEVVAAEEALYGRLAPEVQPYVREGLEATYRVSQMVPYVNAVIPIGEIVKVLPGLAAGEAEAKDSAQIIVNQLLLTTPPVAFVYYGYDLVADLANVEVDAQARKVEFYATAWDALDPNFVLHNEGEDGID